MLKFNPITQRHHGMESLNKKKVVSAAKWSAITEILAKLVSPITTMVLARLLTPEAFGVIATLTMIVSFAEIFTDAGFQKYLIQHEFLDKVDREQSTCVAFWSNLSLSIILFGLIVIFCEPLARIVGNPGLGYVIVIACISIPLQAFSSIQIALYKRDFDFKTLFKVRMLGVLTPIIITIPLAIWLRSYWALVFGTIALNLVNAIVLTIYSNWKIRIFYSFSKLKEMFSFSIWSMVEAISIWLTGYIDIFIIGIYLNEYYLGLYKTSMTTVGQITALITSATTPILFSSLSRLQSDKNSFKQIFFKFQKLIGDLIIPLGVGIFIFRYLITDILLGHQWLQAANFIGLWALTSAVTIVLSHYCSEVYRALGRPRLSVISQFLHIIILCPVMLWAAHHSFDTVYISRSLVRLELVIVNLIIMYVAVNISPIQMLSNIRTSMICACFMGLFGYLLLPLYDSAWWSSLILILCIAIYIVLIMTFPAERRILFPFIKKIFNG